MGESAKRTFDTARADPRARAATTAVAGSALPGGGGIIAQRGVDTLGDPASAALGRAVDATKDPFGAQAISDEQERKFQEALELAKKSKITTDQTGFSQTTFDPRSAQEQSLLDQSIAQFGEQQGLATRFEDTLKGTGALQTQGRQTLQNIAGGGAFALSPEEQARIDAQRQASLDVGSGAVNELINQRLSEVEADAARRGIRGQAFSELQTGAIAEGAKSLERQALAANQVAANQALQMPGQRVGLQAQVGGNLANIQQQTLQQAIQNRELLQDPAALARLQQERLAGGKQETGGTTTQTGAALPGLIQARAQAPGQAATKTGITGSAIGTILEAVKTGGAAAAGGGGG